MLIATDSINVSRTLIWRKYIISFGGF